MQLNEHPLNQRAKELLMEKGEEPWSDMLHILQLLIKMLEERGSMPTDRLYDLDDILDEKKMMERVEEVLKPEDLEDANAAGAAFLIGEAMGFDLDMLGQELSEN